MNVFFKVSKADYFDVQMSKLTLLLFLFVCLTDNNNSSSV